MAEKQFLTKKGYEERVALLENLKVVRRKEVAQKLKEAREQGDLSENAEYDAAKDEQRDIEAQIVELENILKNAEIIQDNDKSKDKIKMESVVKLHDVEYDEDIEYTIVGSSEADSLNNKISNESPLGAALIGKKVGDTVKIEAPVGEIEYKVVSGPASYLWSWKYTSCPHKKDGCSHFCREKRPAGKAAGRCKDS